MTIPTRMMMTTQDNTSTQVQTATSGNSDGIVGIGVETTRKRKYIRDTNQGSYNRIVHLYG